MKLLLMARSRQEVIMTALLLVLTVYPSQPAATLPALKVSENRRFLVTSASKPFFYLADTAWELFHRLDRDEAERYLAKRAEQGFTVIQAVVLAEVEGLTEPNRYGHLPLEANDPARPNEAYFLHVDWIVRRANERGLYVGMLPTWGDKVNKKWGKGPEIFTPANARAYGEFLGKRYRNRGIIWILGGDRPVEKPEHLEIWKAMAAGLRAGDGGTHLVTYHPMGGGRSRQHFQGHDDVLDFHAQQNGHNIDVPVWDRLVKDYAATPIKPVLDMEPLYEGHPIDFKPKERGHSNAADIRKFAYWDVFSGAFGHTYGHHSIWQFYTVKRTPINFPLVTWDIALDAPGANQMKHLRSLIESRPFLTRIPAPELIPDPGGGGKRIVATRDVDRTYALMYCPASRPFAINLDGWSYRTMRVTLFDPRTGERRAWEPMTQTSNPVLTPPQVGENQDWGFILDVEK
jgi:hypothetical protein